MTEQATIPLIQPWYYEGLHFQCTECGQCCTGAPGYTWVTEEEIGQIAEYLGLSVDEFSQTYLRQVGNQYSLKETAPSFDCVFLKEKKCTIYPVRPKQCRTFPWWLSNLSSKEAWDEAARHCEGIRTDAPRVPLEEIEQNLSDF